MIVGRRRRATYGLQIMKISCLICTLSISPVSPRRSIASLNKTSRSVRAWSDCTGERDHLIFYDGSSTNDPVLAKYCGGDWLPKVVAR